ncbi:MAG TPA: hypothetical protein DCS29_01455 [Candidatus Magasanikbacteria bacterium]|nr:hypothetical protein [Candidatus Magasanikbacteria bacterium]
MTLPRWTIEDILKILLSIFLFVLPWQTVLITKEQFLNSVKWEYGTLGFYGTEILLWVIIFVFIGWIFKHKNFKFHPDQIGTNFKFTTDRLFLFSLLLFVLWSFASIMWAGDRDVALQQALHIVESIFIFLLLLTGPLTFRQSGFWFFMGALPSALLGIFQFFLQQTFVSKWFGLPLHVAWQAGTSIVASDSIGRVLRAYGSFSHPNIFGGYMSMALVWGFTLFIVSICAKRYQYTFQFLISAILLFGLFVSLSRSALIGICFALMIMFLHGLYIRKHFFVSSNFIFIIGLFLSLGVIFSPMLQTRFSPESITEVRSITERVDSVDESFKLSTIYTWYGAGIGNYTHALYTLNPTRPGWEYQPVHNMWLLLLVEVGWVGCILAVGVYLTMIVFLYYFVQQKKKRMGWFVDNMQFFYKVTIFSFFYLILAMFDHYLFSSYIGLIVTGIYWGLFCRFTLDHLNR